MSITTISELLQKPRGFRRDKPWQQLTSGSTLFHALIKAVRTNSVGQALPLVNEWESFAHWREKKRDWKTIYKLVWSAEQAVTYTKPEGIVLDRSVLLQPCPLDVEAEEGWERIYINSLLDARPIRSVKIPIAGWNGDSTKGFTATLLLELLPGAGNVSHHPIDAFNTSVDELFSTSIEDAWRAAQTLALRREVDVMRYDGRWRVLEQEEYPLSEVAGRSAGGAAALGWLQALEDTATDERVVVLAEVNREGRLIEVAGVLEKTKAIIDSGVLDTIIVAGDRNLKEAERVIHENSEQNAIRVQTVDDIAAAYEVRSKLTGELIDYCERLIEDLDFPLWTNPQGIRVKVSDIAVPIRVHSTRRSIAAREPGEIIEGDTSALVEPSNISEQEFDSNEALSLLKYSGAVDPQIDPATDSIGISSQTFKAFRRDNPQIDPETDSLLVTRDVVERLAPEPEPPDPFLIQQYQSELYEEGSPALESGQPWSEVWPQGRGLIMIRANPGGGKTLHTRLIIIKAAQDLAGQLKGRKIELSKIGLSQDRKMPVWLTVTGMADNTLPEETAAAVAAAIERQFKEIKFSSAFREYFRNALPDRALLVFDGLDELRNAEQLNMVAKRFRAMRDWSSPCCVTCRTGIHDTETLTRDDMVEYHLAPFRWNGTRAHNNEIRLFILKWFSSDHQRAEELLKILERNYALRHQCRTPLLLTLTCLAHQTSGSAITEKTTHADLFKLVLNGLLSGEWRNKDLMRHQTGHEEISQKAEDDDPFGGLVTERLRVYSARTLLQHITYQLVQKGNESDLRNRFVVGELVEAMTSAPKTYRPQPEKFLTMIEWLVKYGILVPAGYEEGDPCYSFAHRALMEYLFAQALANQNYIERIKHGITDANRFTASAWCAIVPPLVGSITDPVPLIEELIKASQDDAYRARWQVILSNILSCLLESKSALDDVEALSKALDMILMHVDYVQRHKKGNQWRMLGAPDTLRRIFDAVDKHYRIDQGTSVVWQVVDYAWRHHSSLSPDEKQSFIKSLNEVLESTVSAAPVRWAALWGLVVIDRGQALPQVMRALNDSSAIVRALAARALPEVKKDGAFDLLIGFLDDENAYVRGSAASALGNLGDQRAIEFLQPFTGREGEAESIAREHAMWAVATLATPRTPFLAELFQQGLKDEIDRVRGHAIKGLANIAAKDEWPTLVESLSDDSPIVRRQSAWALGRLAILEEDVVKALVRGMTDNDATVAANCCSALLRYALDQSRAEVEAMLSRANESQKCRFIFGLKEVARDDYRSRRPRIKHYSHAAELCLKMLDDPLPSVRVLACLALTSMLRLISVGSDKTLEGRLAERGIELLDDEAPKVRMSACSLFIELIRTNSALLMTDERVSKAILAKSLLLLNDAQRPVKVKACMLLVEIAKSDAINLIESDRLRKTIIEAGIDLLGDATPRVKANALVAFKFLIVSPRIIAAERLRSGVAAWCLELLSTESLQIKLIALFMLKALVPSYTQPTDEHMLQVFAEKSLSLIDDPTPSLKANALVLLTATLTKTDWGNYKSVCLSLMERDLRLTYEEAPEIRTSACWSLAQMAKSRLAIFVENEELSHSIIARLRSLLSDPVPDVRAYALLAFQNLIATSLLLNNEKLLREVANRATGLLKDKSDKVKAYALWALGALVQTPSLQKNNRARAALAATCQKMVVSKNSDVRANALETLDIIISMSAQRDGENISKTTLEKVISLLDDRIASVAARALKVLVDIVKGEPSSFFDDQRKVRLVASRCLKLLSGNDASVHSSALMVLEEILTKTGLKRDEQICRAVTERCLLMLDDSEPEVKAAALIILERILTETKLSEDEQLKTELTDRSLQLLDSPSPKLLAAVYGVLKILAEKRVLAKSLSTKKRLAIVRSSLLVLNDGDPGVQASALMVLEEILTKTGLKRDEQICRAVTERCLLMLDDSEPEVKAAALITLEKVLTQTTLKEDEELSRKLLDKSLVLMNNSSLKLRKAAYGVLSNLAKLGKLATITTKENEDAVVEGIIAAINSNEPQLNSTACWVVTQMLDSEWEPLISNDAILKEIIERSLSLLEHKVLAVRSNAAWMLMEMIRAELAPIMSNPTLSRAVTERGLRLLVEADTRVRANAAVMLAEIVLKKIDGVVSDPQLVQRLFERSRVLMRDSDYSVRASALSILQVITRMPSHAGHNPTYRTIISGALNLLSDSKAYVRKNACYLFIEIIQSRLPELMENSRLNSSLAEHLVNLLSDLEGSVAEVACWALVEMVRAKSPGFVNNQQLIDEASKQAGLLQNARSDELAANAHTLLSEMSAAGLISASYVSV